MVTRALRGESTVLIVGDDATLAGLQGPPDASWRLETVQTPERAIAAALKPGVEMVIIDLALPGLDGYDVYALIKSHEYTHGLPDVPIVALTERSDFGNRARSLSTGFVDHLTKPLERQSVERAFARAGELRPQLHRNQHSLDRLAILGHVREALSPNAADAKAAITGMMLALETCCTQLLSQALLARYNGQSGELTSYSSRLTSVASAIGAFHLAGLSASIALSARGAERQLEQSVVLARAELDRIVFSLREEALGCPNRRGQRTKRRA